MSLALRTARTFWLKRNVKWSAVRPAPAPAGDPHKVSRFLPTRELTNQHHNPASHHECKNTHHRDSAPTPHTAERYAQKQNIEDRYKSIQLNNEKENSICLKSY